MTLSGSSTFQITLGVAAANDNTSLAITTGSVSLNDATLQLRLGSAYSVQPDGTLYTIISGGASATGSNGNVFAQGSSITASNNNMFEILYGVNATDTGMGNDVLLELVAVPEPGTWAMLATGAGLLLVWSRRRRRGDA